MSDFDLYESEIEDLYRPKEEPKVVLTVEEAKAVLKAIDIWAVEDDEIYDKLEERIKQAEKCNGSH